MELETVAPAIVRPQRRGSLRPRLFDAVLVDGAARLRLLHDASIGFPLDDAVWQAPAEVVCHNDFSPHNLAFVEGTILVAIDFDFCSPGPCLWDLAYFATPIVPLTGEPPEGAPSGAEMRRRAQLVLDSYGTQHQLTEFDPDGGQEAEGPRRLLRGEGGGTRSARASRHAEYYEREALFLGRTLSAGEWSAR